MSRAFISVFGIADAEGKVGDELVSIAKVAKAACKHGYGVVPLPPGSKVPNICTLTAQELKAAGPRHRSTSGECGVYHVITDETVAARVFARIQKKFDEPLNIGVVAGPSRLINIDADQASEVEAFQNDWATAENEPGYLAASPTCLSPGAFRGDEWKHKDGGHFYFTVPDDFDWESYALTSYKADGGYEVRWGMQMTVVPPSARAEGPYRPLGDIPPAPQFLLDEIEARNAKVLVNQQRQQHVFADDNIAAWSARTTWADLLIPDEWTDTSRIDKCGCPIFEKPGGGSTTFKSATGHENHCSRWENLEGHGPLHLWTTDPPAPLDVYLSKVGQTITKLRYVALTQFNDDVAMAKVKLGIDAEVDLSDWLNDSVTAVTEPVSQLSHDEVVTEPLSQLSDDVSAGQSPAGDHEEGAVTDCDSPESLGGLEPSQDHLPVDPGPIVDAVMARFNHPSTRYDAVKQAFGKALDEHVARAAKDEYVRAITGGETESVLDMIRNFADSDPTLVTSKPSVLERTDGEFLYHRGRVNYLVGRRGCGKTWVAMVTTAQVLEAGGKAIYFDLEDGYSLFAERMADIGVDIDRYKREGRFVYVKQFETNIVQMRDFIRVVGEFDLVVFDVINKMISRLGGNPDVGNEEAIWLTDNIFDPIAQRGSAVLVLDHPNKKGQRKDAEVEDLNPGGGSMKSNNASGVMVGLQAVRPFSKKNPNGHVRMYCLKDRTGFFVDGECIGELRGQTDLHETGLGLGLRVDPPDAEDPDEDRGLQGDVEDCKAKILAILHAVGPVTLGSFAAKMTAKLRPWVDVSVEQLVVEGLVTVDDKKVSLSEAAGELEGEGS